MFGIVRPCRHRLGDGLLTSWTAHLCGLCLALRGDHGQFARVVTNYDGLLVSVLTEAQSPRTEELRRTAGPCPLRGMRTASVARGEGARLAASVSLVLASAKTRDHIADGDGLLARRPVAAAARRVAAGWDQAGARTGADLGFDTGVLTAAIDRQPEVEAAARPGSPLLAVTEPTETATAAAFAHTALLAGRPANVAPLTEAGRLFGRLAHLLDAVEDLTADEASGAWNPVAATATPLAEVRRLCDDAAHGVRLALRDAEFTDGRLAHVLLVHELPRAVDRAFGVTCAHGGAPHGVHGGRGVHGAHGGAYGPGGGNPYGQQPPAGGGNPYGGDPYGGGNPYGGNPYGGGAPGGPGGPYGGGLGPGPGGRPPKRSFLAGCGAFLALCCTCRMCCKEEYEGPWSRKKREGCCHKCDCCDCCSCDC
ncbi:hypothetical protein DVA86_25735 [Streptomyces armeniacus]|uniref:Cysteine-rich transmembrane CYSTM domain-containing protein n=1 Tax=Streptomyces armeniacus TaxID=83291 RepID=A0A345XV77_9ACTN|nr:DUF5685 family protein [Streptomyces armeniacus]AXK35543.1 hypothetical protein DVA86_25735 [Streptomyces armeniacus]